MPELRPALLIAACLVSSQAGATPPPIEPQTTPFPHLRPAPGSAPQAPVVSALSLRNVVPPAAPRPYAGGTVSTEAEALRAAMAANVRNLIPPSRAHPANTGWRAAESLRLAGRTIDAPQLVVVVDRNPAVEMLSVMLAKPGGPEGWQLIGAAHVSTGQAGRKDYYITPIGVFAHTDAILDFRALGTYNEHHVRGLGLAGMRVWDFGWQWALKGWHTDRAGGDIRLQMHATDPKLLEGRLGRPASEGCVRVSSTMNRFLDRYGILDADYERAAVTDIRYNALLAADRTPTRLAGRLLIVIDTRLPPDAPPTQASRPADWPDPSLPAAAATTPGVGAVDSAPSTQGRPGALPLDPAEDSRP